MSLDNYLNNPDEETLAEGDLISEIDGHWAEVYYHYRRKTWEGSYKHIRITNTNSRAECRADLLTLIGIEIL